MVGAKWAREGLGKIEMHRQKDMLVSNRRVP
jgi:hypothetical protein